MATMVFYDAKNLPMEDFLVKYPELDRDRDGGLLTEALWGSVMNTDMGSRVGLSMWLLDRGADPAVKDEDGTTMLHAMLGGYTHDPVVEAPLLRRLIAGGADVNQRLGKWGTPLQTLWRTFKFTDEFLAPLYDEFFRVDDLDLLSPDKRGLSELDLARKSMRRRAGLVARMEEYLRAHGLEVPPPKPEE